MIGFYQKHNFILLFLYIKKILYYTKNNIAKKWETHP